MTATRARMGNKRGQGRATCSVLDCGHIVKARRLCEKHYMRAYRHGGDITAGEGRYGSGYVAKHGYVVRTLPAHPLAGAKGMVLEHRVVLYDAIGPGAHPCHWCHTSVRWEATWPAELDALVVDHLDGSRANNDRSNLVPACAPCNTRRPVPA